MNASAIYIADQFGPDKVKEYMKSLTEWYFSPDGGLYLTERAREFYFPLQRLLSDIDQLPQGCWTPTKRSLDPAAEFKDFLRKLPSEIGTLTQMEKLSTLKPDDWKKTCRAVSAQLNALVKQNKDSGKQSHDMGKAIFCAVQQASSVVRTVLTEEVGSRENAAFTRLDLLMPGSPPEQAK
jgi:hypothetical protein